MKEVYELYSPKAFSICYHYSKNKEEAADLTQDGFLKIFTESNRIKTDVPLEYWILSVIRNNAINHLKKSHTIFEMDINNNILEAEEDIDEDEENNWRNNITPEEVMNYINLLPLKYQLIIRMYVLDGMKHSEIAKHTGMSEGTSKSQLSRARTKLINIIRNNIQQ